ncbi:MAG: hypothetical protein QMD77_04190 [Patescibacteria group bacterium]|nr:hypothetical protein [Patescibacteria group bacterium]
MKFGGIEIDGDQFQRLAEIMRHPEFQDIFNFVLNEAVKFPINNPSPLEDRVWKLWSDWFRGQEVKESEVKGFLARIILGLFVFNIIEANKAADNLGNFCGLSSLLFTGK